jgi:hypothetical protein
MLNFKTFEAGIRIAPNSSFAADPVTGKVGEIYWNTTRQVLRICTDATPIWQDLFIKTTTKNDATLRWDTTAGTWISNDTLNHNDSLLYIADNNDADAVDAKDLTLQAASKTAGTAAGGDVVIQPGTGTTTDGKTVLNGEKVFIGAQSATDPATGVAGDIYYNTADALIKYHDGTSYRPIYSIGVAGGDRNMALLGGGTVLWDPATDTLSWSESAFLQVPGTNEARNEIAASSAVLSSDEQVLYAEINRDAGVADTLTLTVAALSSLDPSNINNENRVVIARRHNGNVYWGLKDGLRSLPNTSGILTKTTLDDNATNLTAITLDAASNDAIIIKFSLKRDTAVEVGHLFVTNDGVDAAISGNGNQLAVVGVEFNAEINGTDLEIKYDSTSTGDNTEMRYVIERWSTS